MAIKNNRLQDAAPDAASLEDIETLRVRYGVSRPVFVGVCSANGWRRGRQMTAARISWLRSRHIKRRP